jgi:hypothetical protein
MAEEQIFNRNFSGINTFVGHGEPDCKYLQVNIALLT